MRLAQLLAVLPEATVTGDSTVEILDITDDSRRVQPGALFIAVPTVGGDVESGGKRYLETVVQAGAAAVLMQGTHRSLPIPAVSVPDARVAMARVAAAFFRYPSEEMKVYAVTGTDGKTTTTYWLEQIFARLGYVTGLMGTVDTKIGGRSLGNPERMTTPESVDVQRLLREMADAGVSRVALEASSHALALHRLAGCTLAARAYTNITGDHVEFHGSMEEYVRAKSRLFTDFSPQAPAILNRDDPYCERLASLARGQIVTYSVGGDADLRAMDLEERTGETLCTVTYAGQSVWMRVPLPGTYNVSNALAATGLVLTDGHSLAKVADALAEVQAPPGRWQAIEAGQPFQVIVDYAHTMKAFQTVLETARARTEGRVIAVFGAAGNRDRGKRPILARIAREWTDFFVITNEDPFEEDAEAIIAEIETGTNPGEQGERYMVEPDRGAAIRTAVGRARPGDTVLVLGKGHERTIMDGGHSVPWSDEDAVREALGTRV